MILEVLNNKIIIDLEDSHLKSYQLSQIDYYGFKLANNVFEKVTSDTKSSVLKILDFLNEEKIHCKLGKNVSVILDELFQSREEHIQLYKIALRIKNGKLDDSYFHDFNIFLKTLPRELKPHQKKAAYHLYTLKSAANFSVPGSGKTSVVLSVYEKLRIEKSCNILFVVGPPSSFQPWQNEFKETIGRKAKTTILSGGKKHLRKEEYHYNYDSLSELYLTTFQTVMNDYRDVIEFLNHEKVNAFFVVDEAHYMKQLGGSWANSILSIKEYAKHRCILTGTPIPKSYSDIFNLFDFLFPENPPLNEDDKITINILEKKNKNNEVKILLNEKIGPLFYRVRKKDLGLQPAIFHEPFIIEMNPVEKNIYYYVRAKITDLSHSDFLNNSSILSNLWKGRMMRLRQAISNPKLLLTSIENYKEELIDGNSDLAESIIKYYDIEIPAKLQFLGKRVIELNRKQQKVLIWSNFIGTLELIKSYFKRLDLNCELIYGKTPTRKYDKFELQDELTREEIRDIFVNPTSGLDILIANPAACAESISLHKTCYHAFYYDLSYNCAQYLQSLDRIHRVGGSENNTANYYFLQYGDTIDTDIKENLDKKANKMYEIIEQDYEIYNLDLYDDSEEDDITAYKRLFHSN